MNKKKKIESSEPDLNIQDWEKTEKKYQDLLVKKTYYLERDDTFPNYKCGQWYYEAKEFIENEASLPDSLLSIYKIVTFIVFVNVFYWVCCCLLIPVVGMHIVERYITTDIRIQFTIYWAVQPFQFVTYIFTLSKLTMQHTRYSLILCLINISWHVVHISLQHGLEAKRQGVFSEINSVIYYIEIVINLGLLITTFVMSKQLHEILDRVHRNNRISKTQWTQNVTQVQPEEKRDYGDYFNNENQMSYINQSNIQMQNSEYPINVNQNNLSHTMAYYQQTEDPFNNSLATIQNIQAYNNPDQSDPQMIMNRKMLDEEKVTRLMEQSRLDLHQKKLLDKRNQQLQQNKIYQFQKQEEYTLSPIKQAQQQRETMSQQQIWQKQERSKSFLQHNLDIQSQQQEIQLFKSNSQNVKFQSLSPIKGNKNISQFNEIALKSDYSLQNQKSNVNDRKKFNLIKDRNPINTSALSNKSVSFQGDDTISPQKQISEYYQPQQVSIIQKEFNDLRRTASISPNKQRWGSQKQQVYDNQNDKDYELEETRKKKFKYDLGSIKQ